MDRRGSEFFNGLMDVLRERARNDDPELAYQKQMWVHSIVNPHAGYGGMADIYMTL